MLTCSAADTLHEQQKVGLEEPHPLVQSALKSIEKREFASGKPKFSLALRGAAELKRKECKAGTIS